MKLVLLAIETIYQIRMQPLVKYVWKEFIRKEIILLFLSSLLSQKVDLAENRVEVVMQEQQPHPLVAILEANL